MAGASRKKQNSLMHKELNNFERVISHALGRFKLDMWYDMLTRIIPESTEVTSLSALQELVQKEKERLGKAGEDPRNNVVIMYFRDFFRDISQLRRMKDIFHTRIYLVLFEYYYDVDAIQEISDVAKTAEEAEKCDKEGVGKMSELKNRNLSQKQQEDFNSSSSQFSPEVVAELADDCIEISSIIGELKRLDFAWGHLLNEPEIDKQFFSSGNDDQFRDYDNFQHFEGVFKFIPDILQKSQQAIVLARNWWFKAEKIQNRLSKLLPPTSRQVSARNAQQKSGGNQDLVNNPEVEPFSFDQEDEIPSNEDVPPGAEGEHPDHQEPTESKDLVDDLEEEHRSEEWAEVEENLEYSDDFDDDDDIIEDFGEGDLSDEEDIFLSSDPGAIVVEKNKTPVNNNDVDRKDENEHDNSELPNDDGSNDVENGADNDVGIRDNGVDINGDNAEDEGNDYTDLAANDANILGDDADVKESVDTFEFYANQKGDDKDVKEKANQNKIRSSPTNQRKAGKPSRRAKPPEARKEFATNNDANDDITAKEQLLELNNNIDAHQRELEIQIEELRVLCSRNQRVKSLCETLDSTIEKQISQRKEAQELMTMKESLKELAIQDTTTPAKQKKIEKHLETINKKMDELLQSGKLRAYQDELLKEDLELQIAVSPTLVSYGNQVQDQIETLESQLEQEREKLTRLQREFDFISRRGKAGQRRHERLKAAEKDGKSFSADAVKKTRTDDSRNRDAAKPARHSDGSAGGNLRDSYQSASSGSVFLNEGDIEEFDDVDFEDDDAEIEELLEIDSGMGETWEEIGKPNNDLPRTPAPPRKDGKAGKKVTNRPGRGQNEGQRETKKKKTTGKNKPEEQQMLGSTTASLEKQAKPTDERSSKRSDRQSQRRGVVNKNTTDKPGIKSRKKGSPKKNKVIVEPKQQTVERIQDDQAQDENQIPILGEASNEANSEGKEDSRETGHGLFGSDYRYPDSGHEDHQESKTNQGEPTTNQEKHKTNRKESTANHEEPTTNRRESPKPAGKRTKKTPTQDREKENTTNQPDGKYKPDDPLEITGETPTSTQKKPPIGDTSGRQPKPPANKSTRTRTRARAVPVKDASTSEEEIQAQGEQGKSSKRSTRNLSKERSKGRRTRSLSKGRAEPVKDENNDNAEGSNKRFDKVGRNARLRRKESEGPEVTKNSRPAWKSNWGK